MKDLLEFLAKNVQTFLPLFIRILAHPQRNILTLARRTNPVADALVFFAICLAIGSAIQAPFITENYDLLVVVGVLSVERIMEFVIAAFALTMIFRLLRGQGGYEAVLTATLYIFCAPYVIVIFFELLTVGLLHDIEAALADDWRRNKDLSSKAWEVIWTTDWKIALGAVVVLLAQTIGLVIWFVICWPIYNRLNGFGWARGAISFVLGMSAIIIIGESGKLVVNAIFPLGWGGLI